VLRARYLGKHRFFCDRDSVVWIRVDGVTQRRPVPVRKRRDAKQRGSAREEAADEAVVTGEEKALERDRWCVSPARIERSLRADGLP